MTLLDKEPVKRVEEKLRDFNPDFKVIILDTSARTAQEAASRAVLAELSKITTFFSVSKLLKILWTLLTGSLSNKVIIQLLIVSYFKHLCIHLCENCIGVIK